MMKDETTYAQEQLSQGKYYCRKCMKFLPERNFYKAVTDMKSDVNGGMQRTIAVYTADGKELATYKGKIDIDTNDGGYVKFDLNGKRYIYYNCFVESIADID